MLNIFLNYFKSIWLERVIKTHKGLIWLRINNRPGRKILSKFQVQGQVGIFIFKTRTKYFAA